MAPVMALGSILGDWSDRVFVPSAYQFLLSLSTAWLFSRLRRKPLAHYGLSLPGDPKAMRAILLVVPIAVLPAIVRAEAIISQSYRIDSSALLLLALGTAVLGPAAEELLFRGCMLTTLMDEGLGRPILGVSPESWYVSILFMAAHLVGQKVPLALLLSLNLTKLLASLVFCRMYERTRSLAGPFLGHALMNALVLSPHLVLNW